MDHRLFGTFPDQHVRTFRGERTVSATYRKRLARRRGVSE